MSTKSIASSKRRGHLSVRYCREQDPRCDRRTGLRQYRPRGKGSRHAIAAQAHRISFVYGGHLRLQYERNSRQRSSTLRLAASPRCSSCREARRRLRPRSRSLGCITWRPAILRNTSSSPVGGVPRQHDWRVVDERTDLVEESPSRPICSTFLTSLRRTVTDAPTA